MRGHIRKRGKSWCVVVDLGADAEGRRRQKWHSGFLTKREASAALTDVLGRLQNGDYIGASRETLGSFLEEWIESSRVTLRPGTWQSYKGNLTAYVIPALGSTRLQALKPSALNKFYADLLKSGRRQRPGGLSARTVRLTHVILQKALQGEMPCAGSASAETPVPTRARRTRSPPK